MRSLAYKLGCYLAIKTAADLSEDAAKAVGERIGVDWEAAKFPVNQFRQGLKEEHEHDDVTYGDEKMTARLVLPHLKKLPDYYTKLKKMEGD